jgi:hypothetical protein
MAQTKRKRKTKHRGNAAGMIETRGRVAAVLRLALALGLGHADAKAKARTARVDRMNTPPTWRGAMNRAAIATVIFVVALLVLFKQSVPQTLGLAGFIFLLYIPLGYYTDLYLYRWRQKRKTGDEAKGGKR